MYRRVAEAEVAATRLLGSPTFSAADYCEKIRLAYEQEQIVASSTSWMDLTRNPDLRRLLIAVGIQSLQQAQGSSYMNSYVVSFLVGTGVTDVFPVIMGMSLHSIANMQVCTACTMWPSLPAASWPTLLADACSSSRPPHSAAHASSSSPS